MDISKERIGPGDAEENEQDHTDTYCPWIGTAFILRTMDLNR